MESENPRNTKKERRRENRKIIKAIEAKEKEVLFLKAKRNKAAKALGSVTVIEEDMGVKKRKETEERKRLLRRVIVIAAVLLVILYYVLEIKYIRPTTLNGIVKVVQTQVATP